MKILTRRILSLLFLILSMFCTVTNGKPTTTSTTSKKSSTSTSSTKTSSTTTKTTSTTTSNSSPSPTPNLLTSLFPANYTYTSGFTTASEIFLPPGIAHLTLSDASLNVIKISSNTSHPIVTNSGKTAWMATYPAGSFSPGNDPEGGFGFYLGGSTAFLNKINEGANEVVMGYSVMFEEGFQWVMGGKIPGIFGGEGSLAYDCSGGRQDNRYQCFDMRLMWRTSSLGELYTYLPPTTQNDATLLSVPPYSALDDDYGYSVGRGAWTFPSGAWTAIAERVKMNDVGSTNGEIQLWINGTSVINIQNLQLRNSSISSIQGMHFQTFFGGSTNAWASPVNQNAWFADVSGGIISS